MADIDIEVPHGEDVWTHEDGTAIFNLFRATLQLNISSKDKIRKLCTDIDFLIADALMLPDEDDDEDSKLYHTPIYTIWNAILVLSCYVPPDHPWQDILVELIDTLRQRDGDMAPGDKEWEGHEWKDLPEFANFIRMTYDDNDNFPLDEGTPNRHPTFQNFLSFCARVSTPDFFAAFPEGFLGVKLGLETPLTPEPGINMWVRAWIATEWLMRCSEGFHKNFAHPIPGINERNSPQYRGGPLCPPDIVPFSLERWEFWKTRLGEIKENPDKLFEEGDGLSERIDQALAAMEGVTREANGGDTTGEEEARERAFHG